MPTKTFTIDTVLQDNRGAYWATNDMWDPIKMNKKSRFVGTGAQATALITSPQRGQCVFVTATDATFTKADKHYFRNSANTSYVDNVWTNTEYTNTVPAYTTNLSTLPADGNNSIRHYTMLTLPTTYRFYKATHLEIIAYCDSTSGQEFWMGADLLDSETPTATFTQLVVWSAYTNNNSPFNTINTIKVRAGSDILKAGDILGLWINTKGAASGPSRIYGTNATRYNRTETFVEVSVTPFAINKTFDVAWSTTASFLPGIKLYATGWN